MAKNQHSRLTDKDIEFIHSCMDQYPHQRYTLPGSRDNLTRHADKYIQNLPIDKEVFIENHLGAISEIYFDCINQFSSMSEGSEEKEKDIVVIKFRADLKSKIEDLIHKQNEYIFSWVNNERNEVDSLLARKCEFQEYQPKGIDEVEKKEQKIKEIGSQIDALGKIIHDTFKAWQDKPIEKIIKEHDKLKSEKAKGGSEPKDLSGQEDLKNTLVFKQDRGATGWTIGMKGNTKSYSDLDGFLYIRCLLQNPNKEIDCLDLYNLKQDIKGDTGKHSQASKKQGTLTREEDDNEIGYDDADVSNLPCELTKPEVIVSCKNKLKELRSEKNELSEKIYRNQGEEIRLEKIDNEIKEITKYLLATTDKTGKIRNAKDNNSRCRDTVTKSINRALEKLSSLSELLNERTIKTDFKYEYQPDNNNIPTIETE